MYDATRPGTEPVIGSTPLPGRSLPPRWRRLLQWTALLLVGAFWAWYLLRIWGELSAYQWQWSLGPVLAAVILWIGYTAAQAWGWVLLTRAVGGAIEAKSGSRIWLLSMPARYVPGNVWHVLSRVYMGSRAGLSAGSVLLSSTLEQGMMVIGPLVVFLLSLMFWVDRLDHRFLLLALLLPAGLGCLHPRILLPLVRLVSRLFRKPAPVLELRYGQMIALAGWYALGHFLSSLAGCLVVASLAPVALPDVPVFVGAYALAYLVGYLSFLTPTGLGVREAALLGLLSLLMPSPVAAVAALLSRALSSLAEMICVAGLAGAWRPRPRESER